MYLDMGQLVKAARVALAGGEPKVVSRKGLLRCVAEPAAVAGPVEVYPTLAEKAAAVMVAVTRTVRPFEDGNKRTGFAAATLLLNVNGHRLVMPPAQASVLIDKVAYGELPDPEAVAAVLAPHIVATDQPNPF
jgi:death-on-curing protein